MYMSVHICSVSPLNAQLRVYKYKERSKQTKLDTMHNKFDIKGIKHNPLKCNIK